MLRCGKGPYERMEVWAYVRPYTAWIWLVCFTAALLSSEADAQVWQRLDVSAGAAPAPRRNAAVTYDPVENRLIVHGGRTDSGDAADVWAFDLDGRTWTELTPGAGPAPDARFAHNGVYDAAAHRMIIWSGQGNGFYNDVWAFDLTGNTWTELTPESGSPARRYGSAAVYDPESGSLVMFAGFTDQGRFDDTQAFSLAANMWTDLTPEGDGPVERCLHTAVYDPDRHRMLIYGGQRTGALGDLWAFDLSAPLWTELTPPEGPAARFFSAIIYGGGRLILFGGTDGSARFSDLWAFDFTAGAWSELTAAGDGPAARYGHAAVYVPGDSALVIYGGLGEALLGDVWQLSGGLVTGTEAPQPVPEVSRLEPAWPNPAGGHTTIRYVLSEAGPVALSLHDVLGRTLRTPVAAWQAPGTYTVMLDLRGLPPGLYVCRLQHRGAARTHPLLKIH